MTRLELYQSERLRKLEAALTFVWNAFQGGDDHPWIPGGDSTKDLRKAVAYALGKPTPGREVIGYRTNGKFVYRPLPGSIQTQCCISCMACGKGISGSGGPCRDAMCPTCWEHKND